MAESLLRAMSVSRAPFMALGGTGVIWGTFAAMVPVIKQQSGASDALFGTGLLGSAAGGMLAMYLAPRFNRWLGRIALPVLAALSVLALQLPLLAQTPGAILPVMLGLGVAVASFDISANLRISALESRHGLHLMNLNHAMFSLSFGIASLVVAGLRHTGLGPGQIFPLMGFVVALMGAVTLERRAFTPEGDEANVVAQGLPWGTVLLIAVMMFVSFVGENTVESWSALFLERELGAAPGHGGFGPAMLGLTMAAFRLAGQFTTQALGERRVILWSGVIGMLGALVLSQAPTQAVALIGIALMAVGMSVIVPTATSLLGHLVSPGQRDLAISRAWMLGFVGFFAGPSTIGFLSEQFGLRVAFLAVAGLIALIVPAVLRLPAGKTQPG
jgi:Dipeptide/tripeptide permease